MARKKAEIPSIVHLKILMELYRQIHSTLKYARREGEYEYLRELGTCLTEDKIFTKPPPKSLVYKLNGIPFHSEPKKCDGIEADVLHKIARLVIDYFSIEVPEEDKNLNQYHWWIFNRILVLPTSLRALQENCYYKFLNENQKSEVDNYVVRKVSELTPISQDVVSYCGYFWDEVDRVIQMAILTINKTYKQADLKYVYKENGQLSKRVEQTSKEGGAFALDKSNCYMTFVGEDNQGYLRTTLYFAAHSSDFFKPDYIKGTYSSIKKAGESCIAGTMLLEKKASYREAEEFFKTENASDKIYIELKEQRIVLANNKIRYPEEFDTAAIARLIANRLKGGYIFAFLKRPTEDEPPMLTRGICFIEDNGESKMQISGSDWIIHGHIDTTEYNEDMFCLVNIFSNAGYNFKYRYYLKPRKKKNTTDIEYFEGVYAGIDKHQPRAGEILFIKKPASEDFEELKLKEKFGYLSMDEIVSEDDKLFYERLYKKEKSDKGFIIDTVFVKRATTENKQ